jgi:hypothetical protein
MYKAGNRKLRKQKKKKMDPNVLQWAAICPKNNVTFVGYFSVV